MINIAPGLLYRIRNRMRTDAWFIRSCVISAFAAGLFPDAISHGILWAGRTGHIEILYISALAITIISSLYILSWAYSSRYNITPSGPLDVVE